MRKGVFLLTALTFGMSGCSAPSTETASSLASLRCEYRVNPQGIDTQKPRLSWRMISDKRAQAQSAYRVLVASTLDGLAADEGDLWDSGKVSGGDTVNILYEGAPLASGQRYFWKVQGWDNEGHALPWSEPAQWSMGLLAPSDWKAEWISFRDNSPVHKSREQLHLPPARYYRKEQSVQGAVRRATVYASALGLYELHINGNRVGDDYFTPGWSDYRQRAYYQTYDVTELLQQGANAIGAIVADGWYSGYVGYGLLVGYGPYKAGRDFYGKTPAFLAQLEIEYDDGQRQTIVTDENWKVSTGPILEADMLMGEAYDARLEEPEWATAGFDEAGWETAIRAEENGSVKAPFFERGEEREVELGFTEPGRMQAYPGPPVRAIEEIKPVSINEPKQGAFVFDLGQNFSGVVRLQVRGNAGQQVQLRHAEMLHQDGTLMTENLRKARAIDTYILRGDPDGETWMPRFTYHGFQYVELTGYPEKPDLDAVTGIVMHSDTPLTSTFETSDEMVTQLHQNIVWTQRSNYFEVPTDCPQRDERLGWTGDAQTYVRAASYNADVASFFTKWLDDLEEAQRPNGAFTDYAPYPMRHGPRGVEWGTAWMDAGVICPYVIHQVYNDQRAIDRHYDAMKKFIDFRRQRSPEFRGVDEGNSWGDWLSLGEDTPLEYVDAAYFAFSAKLMATMAETLGKQEDSAAYQDLFGKVHEAFQKEYVRENGRLTVDTQTAYALALFFDLLGEEDRAAAADRLAQKIRDNDTRMATGFLGTYRLMPALSMNGHHDLAVRLLQSRKHPSWGYEVINGATTIWERWNSYTKDGGFFEPSMNSFSHYAFGAVSEWMFRFLAGIDTDGPGFKKIIIRPGPPSPGSNPDQEPIHWVKASYDSLHGKIVSDWKRETGQFSLDVTIPPNTSATVYLPASAADGIEESGNSLDEAADVRFLRMEEDRAVLAVESGAYSFTAPVE